MDKPLYDVIIIAAGLSRRMGEHNKLLLRMNSKTLIENTVTSYQAISDRIHVVTGYQSKTIEAVLEPYALQIVFNADYSKGQSSSVWVGLEACPLDRQAVIIALADQPHLTPDDISAFMRDYAAHGSDKIHIPYYDNQRGNPVIAPTTLIRHALSDPHRTSLRDFIDTHPQHSRIYNAPNAHFVTDIDTPLDYQRISGLVLGDTAP